MPNIDTLSIQFSSKGTQTAVENIKGMASAVRVLSGSMRMLDTSKFADFSHGMETLKKSVPTKAQTTRMVDFADAISKLSAAIGASNISGFSTDMANLGTAVQTFKRSSVNGITSAVTAMQSLGQQAQKTATTISNATPKKSGTPSMGNNIGDNQNIKNIVASLDKVQVKASGVKGILQKMGMVVPTKSFKTLEENAEKVRQKYEQLRQTLQKGMDAGKITSDSSEYVKKMAELDGLRNKYDELILKQRQLAQEGGAFATNPAFSKFAQSLEPFKNSVSQTASILKNGLIAGIRFANNHIKSFVSRLTNMGKALKNTVTQGNSATKMAKKFANEIFRVSKMLKLMVTRMALRKVIAEVGDGFKSLAVHSDEFNNSVSSMMNGAKKLGYSFAAMVSPLINALAPAIVYVINLLTKLANIINQVFSALTGSTTWNKAKDFTDSWRDSFEDTADAAKDAEKQIKKTVLGFDELNQLTDNSDKQSKNKGGGGIADMFETEPIDSKWKDIADWLKKMWELGDFYDLGKKLGEKLRDWLESIPWDQIRKTANKLGKSLATLINGFVEVERLGYDIGYTIAQSVNTVFEFLNGFVHNLHWDSIGKFIADTFNGFFENIDWKLIKDTVVTGMAGIAEAIQSFIENFHWDNISNFIINAVDTIVSGIKAFVDGINWYDLGVKIGDQLNKTISGIDWHEVGETLGDVIMAAVDWAYGLVKTFDPEGAIQALTDFLDGICESINFEEVGETLGMALHKLIDVIQGFWGNEENRKKVWQAITDFFNGVASQLTLDDFAFLLEVAIGLAGALALKNALKVLLAEALSMGSAIAGSIAAGIVAFFVGAEIGKMIGEYLFPDDKELYEGYKGIAGTMQMVKDLIVSIGDFCKMYFEVWMEDVVAEAHLVTANVKDLLNIGDIITRKKELAEARKEFEEAQAHTKALLTPDEYVKEIATLGEFKNKLNELGNEFDNLKGKVGEGGMLTTFNSDVSMAQQSTEGLKNNTTSLASEITETLNPSMETAQQLTSMLNEKMEESNSYGQKFSEMLAEAGNETEKLNTVTTQLSDNVASSYKNLATSGEEFHKTTKGIADETEKASNKIKEAKGTTDGLNTELSNASGKMSDLKRDTEDMSTSVSMSSEIMKKLSGDLKDTKESSKNYTDMASTVNKDSKDIQSAVDGIKFETAEVSLNEYSQNAIDRYLEMKEAILGDTEEIDTTVNDLDFTEANKEFADLSTETTKSMDDTKKTVETSVQDINKSLDTIKQGMTKEKWTFQGVADGLGETFRRAKDAIKREWNSIAETLNGEHEVASEKIKIDLPKFARGGFPEDGLFYANHSELVGSFANGKTAVANNAQIIEGISSGVYGAVTKAMAQNNGNGKYISNTIVVDGEVIARTVTKAQERQDMRYSPTTG